MKTTIIFSPFYTKNDFKSCEHKFERGYVSDMCVYCIKCNRDADEIYPGMPFTDQLKLV